MSSQPRIRAGIDWGSSSFRAYRFDAGGEVLESLDCEQGIKSVYNAQYEQVLFDNIGHWLQPGDAVLLSGMITSRSGWMETPYLRCPARPASDISTLSRLSVRETQLLFMPGLCQSDPGADVMRGEELQLLGASATPRQGDGQGSSNTDSPQTNLVILPGTHSKWALASGASILGFITIPTGEVFDCLVRHSLIGAFADTASWDEQAYLEGVTKGHQTNNIMSLLFTARAGVLLDQLRHEQVYAYLSGLLIGNEIREGSVFTSGCTDIALSDRTATLVGSELLCRHYRQALQALNYTVSATHTDAAAAGFSRIVTEIKNNNA